MVLLSLGFGPEAVGALLDGAAVFEDDEVALEGPEDDDDDVVEEDLLDCAFLPLELTALEGADVVVG
jgi:hypothetical protein